MDLPRLSIAFDGSVSLADALRLVKAADSAGLHGVWSAEHLGLRDSVVPSAAFLAATERVKVGLVGVNHLSRHPGLLAMEVASLAEMAPGRVRLQIGTGDVNLGRRLGLRTLDQALHNVEELAGCLRDLLDGKRVTQTAPAFTLKEFGLSAAPTEGAPPIALMAIRPKMIELAARVGDGVALSMGASPSYIDGVSRAVAATLSRLGRDRAEFTISSGAVCVVDDDQDGAERRAAQAIVFAAAGDGRPVIAPDADLPEPAHVRSVLESRGPAEAAELITPEAVRTMAVACTPESLPAVLARYAAAGVDELALKVVGRPDHQLRTIELLANMKEGSQ